MPLATNWPTSETPFPGRADPASVRNGEVAGYGREDPRVLGIVGQGRCDFGGISGIVQKRRVCPIHPCPPDRVEQYMMHQASPGPSEDFTIDTEDGAGVTVIQMGARVTGQRLVRALEALARLNTYEARHPRLWDLREADLSQLTRAELRVVARRVRTLDLSLAESRVAVVVSRDVDFGVVRMFELTEADSLSGAIRAFRDITRAHAWVSAPADED